MITKQATDLSVYNFEQGEEILIDKPFGWSSFKAVFKVRKAINVKKVGHSGTLDPYATGLLILCTGKKTKELTSFLASDKVYSGTFTLGKKTLSMDAETDVVLERPTENIEEKDILKARDAFIGKIFQMPPMYSALNHGGKKLYQLAREGKEVDRKLRVVYVHDFQITKIEMPLVYFEIKCSKGTYIRVIANDFGEKLGCGAYLSSLRRIKIGNISVDDAINADDFVDLAKKTVVIIKKKPIKKFKPKSKFKKRPRRDIGNNFSSTV
jgi:tRNA pseudouridine55 synthase